MLYIFDDYVLDTQRHELHHADVPVKLEPQAFRALAYLIQHRDRAVSRQDLFDHLWPHQFVSDAALERCIAVVRRAIGDSRHTQHCIKTLPRYGYRFVATLEERLHDFPQDRPRAEQPLESALAGEPDEHTAVVSTTDTASVVEGAHSSAPPHLSHSAIAGERKSATVLCGALAHTTSLAEHLGLGALHCVIQDFFALVQQQVQQYEGTFQPFGHDGFLAFFGAPTAQEDHARRAVLVALGLQQYLRTYHTTFEGQQSTELAVRLGLHTGLVVVGSGGVDLYASTMVAGDTTSLAAHLQYLSDPGTLLVSEVTMRMIKPEVHSAAHGLVHVPGQADPVMVYKVLGLSPQRSFAIRHEGHTLSQFVGRERELATLHELLARVEAGEGQVSGIVGEAGIGKSRLLYEFRQRLQEQQVTYLEARCFSYGRAIPYLPVLDVLRNTYGIADAEAPAAIVAKVQQGLQNVGLDPEKDAPYLLQLFGLPEGTERLAMLTPEAIQGRTFLTLRRMTLNSGRQQPLVLVVEDLQWIDTTSEAFLASLVEDLAGAPVLLLTTYRPGFRPSWVDKSYATQMALHRLRPHDSLTVVQAVQAQQPLRETLTQGIVTRGDGNPFFLEELTRMVMERGDGAAIVTVPETIQEVLMARIDRLPEAPKRVLQTASVLGREVSLRLLHMMCREPGDLESHLQALKRLEFLYEQTRAEESVCVFKHALIQDVAYQSLLLSHRQALHTAAGRALETLYADRLVEVYDRLAYHYARTAEADKAVTYLTRFAEKAAQGYAHAEAVTALHEALHHAEQLPTTERDRRILDLVIHLVHSLHFLSRFPESLRLLLAHQERVTHLQDVALAGVYHLQLGFTYSLLGDHEHAMQSAQRALAAAGQCRDEATMGRAHYVCALEAYWAGQPLRGIEHGQQAVRLLRHTDRHWSLGVAYIYLSANYVLKGDFGLALEAVAEARTLGEAIQDPSLQSYAAWIFGWVHATRGDWEVGIAACQQGLARAPAPLNTLFALGALGHAYLEKGDAAQAIPVLQQAAEQSQQFRHQPLQTWMTTLLAEAYLLQGDLERARSLALQALDIARAINNAWGMGIAQHALGRIARASGSTAEEEPYLTAALATFVSMPAQFKVGQVHLDLAILTHTQENCEAVTSHLRKAHTLFTSLDVPIYAERIVQLARTLSVSLAAEEV